MPQISILQALLLLGAFACTGAQVPTPPDDSIVCPYPPPSAIRPCLCLADPENFDVYLQCAFEFSRYDEGKNYIFANIIAAFDSYKEIHVLDMHCDQCWNKNFQGELSENTTGRLKISHFKFEHFDIANHHNGSAYFHQNAFLGSKDTLKSLHMDSYHGFTLEDNFLSGFNSLEQLVMMRLMLETGQTGPLLPSDSDWSKLRFLSLSGSFLRHIDEQSFLGLQELASLYLDHTSLYDIKPGTFQDLINLQNLSLSNNNLNLIPKNTFKNLSSLAYLDLSNNQFQGISDDFSGLNANTQINLSNNNITTLTEATFRPFVEQVMMTPLAQGSIDLDMNPLECSCDVKWIIVDLKAAEVFHNAYCYENGIPLDQVDPDALEFFCPDW